MPVLARSTFSSIPQLPLFAAREPDAGASLYQAARLLVPHLARGRFLDVRLLRSAMTSAFGGSDAAGAWAWKDAYDACEAAQVLWLRDHVDLIARNANSHAELRRLEQLLALVPTHTRRSEDSQALQQFSTPVTLGYVASVAARIMPGDVVLEPSAGTGLLAVFTQAAGARLVLNELAGNRAALLRHLFRGTPVTAFDAEHIDDRLGDAVRPSVVLMNPPFSASPHVTGRNAAATVKHVGSALARLAEGGRLVAITGSRFAPWELPSREAFARLQQHGRIVFTAALSGDLYKAHGTSTATRLTVFDRVPAENPRRYPACAGEARDVHELLDWVLRHVPARVRPAPAAEAGSELERFPAATPVQGVVRTSVEAARPAITDVPRDEPAAAPAVELAYTVHERSADSARLSDGLYEGYALQTLAIPGAQPHPTRLVQSAAMASVVPPKPAYRPHVPADLVGRGLLSDAQLESLIYAGEAHAAHLAGSWTLDPTFDVVSAAPDQAAGAVRFRRGCFLGDGTGAGKGRQIAGIILDNWLKGRRRALWVSKSDKLIEDARRDWSALGGSRADIIALGRFKQEEPIALTQGIVFTTYATLRSAARQGDASRLQQIIDWCGLGFDGVIVFDEAHAMANAAGGASGRGERAASEQGRAGLRLQHALANARVVYVSATGATTVQNLGYAQRLGLWGGTDFPFATRAEFVQAMEAGGVAAMEVLARDLKALGLYAARSLSYEGITYEMLEHRLSAEQIRIYDAYAGAFQVIHQNLEAALEAANITGAGSEGGSRCYNGQAKSAARSAFESAKQRFFNHLITAMKVPTLIGAIEADLAAGHAAVVQIVSTGEALLERRLAEIPSEEWGDICVDITPREYVLDYLAHSFPTQLHELYSDEEGKVRSRPVFDTDGNPVQCRDAVARRQRMIETLASLPPVPGALDQLVQRFGTSEVAEVTGRSRRVVRKTSANGGEVLCVESRAPSANLAEAQAFQDDEKRILIFSDAGGTGRSYHADLGAKNQRLRVHYLLEAGWKADTAIQGLGRSNRTNQKQPPVFRPVTTDVRGEKRFLSTIARRLDTLGAITRGQRQTGGQGLLRAEDNLEGPLASAALRQFFQLVFAGKVEGCSLNDFEDATGLELGDADGTLRETLPPVTTFLNRLLSLPIALQNRLFSVFEDLLNTRIDGAIAAGTYDRGVETVMAESLVITERHTVYTHSGSGAETRIFKLTRKDRNRPLQLVDALALADAPRSRLLINRQSGRAAVQVPAPTAVCDDGSIAARVRLIRPASRETLTVEALDRSHWDEVGRSHFSTAWTADLASIPEFNESSFCIVTGLLLPIWTRLPSDEGLRVYRLQTDAGERVIGRLLSPAAVGAVCRNLGIGDGPALSGADAWQAVLESGATLQLANGLTLRRTRAMGEMRVELAGFTDGAIGRLKAMGLVSEIIAWKLRLFVPVNDSSAQILAKVLDRHPLVEARARQAA